MKAWEIKMEDEIISIFKETDIVRRVGQVLYNEPHKGRREELLKVAVVDRLLGAFKDDLRICAFNHWIDYGYKHRLFAVEPDILPDHGGTGFKMEK